MARCGCATACSCVLADGDCTEVTGSGSVASPYVTNLVLDPEPSNQLFCTGAGLLGIAPHIQCACISDLPAPVIPGAPGATVNFDAVGAQFEIPDGVWVVYVAIDAIVQWEADQGGSQIHIILDYETTPGDVAPCGTRPTLRTNFRTGGTPGEIEVETLHLARVFGEVTGPISTLDILPHIITNAGHATVMSAESATVSIILGVANSVDPQAASQECDLYTP